MKQHLTYREATIGRLAEVLPCAAMNQGNVTPSSGPSFRKGDSMGG